MSSIPLEIIIDRLITKYGREGFELLKTAEFTAEQLRSSNLDPDRYAFLMATRGDEVEKVLNEQQNIAKISAFATAHEIREVFARAKKYGKIWAPVLNKWIQDNFSGDIERFKELYPQAVATQQIWASEPGGNAQILYREIWRREVATTLAELVISFNEAMNPRDGSMPKLRILCPDGEVRTGKPLKDAIRRWPLELLEPGKPSRQQAQSADEFLAEHPELKDTRQSPLLVARFNAEFQRFLKSDVGRAWRTRMDAVNFTEDSSSRLYDYMVQHNLPFQQNTFEQAAIAVANEVSVTLFAEDIGGARTQGLTIHDGGGNRDSQLPVGMTMAGQHVATPYNPDKKWTEAEVRSELRRLSADELKERMADKAFVDALNQLS
jgi:hypothetical protein